MSLDVSLHAMRKTEVYSSNITHNLGRMADVAGIYQALWRPEELDIKLAGELIPLLRDGLARLRINPEGWRAYDAPNGWGKYEHFFSFVEQYLKACEENPDAEVSVCR